MIIMDKDKLIDYFESTTPENDQKSRMKKMILTGQHKSKTVSKRKWYQSGAKVSMALVSLALVFLLVISLPFGGKSVAYGIKVVDPSNSIVTMEDHDGESNFLNHVNSRPDLRFFIEGEDIAKIEITTDTEYITAVDWTETQHEKYWNPDYYQQFDEETQNYITDFDLIYDKQLIMEFDKDFTDYHDIWFEWSPEDLYKWAAADDFAHFLGYGIKVDDLSEDQKLKMASGDGTGIGHIQLDGYPEHLREDTITITITDYDDQQITKSIHVSVSNNDLRQTVVKAFLEE